MIDTPNNNSISEKDFLKPQNAQPRPGRAILISAVVLSLVFGGVGGTLGTLFVLHQPFGQKILSKYFSITEQHNITINESSAIIDLVKKASPAVVSIVASEDLNKIPGYGTDPFDSNPFDIFFGNGIPKKDANGKIEPNVQEVAWGSGFFVSADGLIFTNRHVVSIKDASYTVITSDGKTYDAKILAQDQGQDLALIKIDIKNATYLNFANSSKLQIGQQVVAIGNSLGLYQNTVTAGIISGIGRKITAGDENESEDLSGVIQTDAAINPGNSGGPLLDIEGNVVGVNTAINQEGQLVGFAIPSNDVTRAIASYKQRGKIVHAFLGVRYTSITPAIAKEKKLSYDYGALVVRGNSITELAVSPGSPADKAGIVEDDIILEIDGQKLTEKNNLSDVLKNHKPEDIINLKIFHKGKSQYLNITLTESK